MKRLNKILDTLTLKPLTKVLLFAVVLYMGAEYSLNYILDKTGDQSINNYSVICRNWDGLDEDHLCGQVNKMYLEHSGQGFDNPLSSGR